MINLCIGTEDFEQQHRKPLSYLGQFNASRTYRIPGRSTAAENQNSKYLLNINEVSSSSSCASENTVKVLPYFGDMPTYNYENSICQD